jgi:hypothetical protein
MHAPSRWDVSYLPKRSLCDGADGYSTDERSGHAVDVAEEAADMQPVATPL